jgi:hypothetical protein
MDWRRGGKAVWGGAKREGRRMRRRLARKAIILAAIIGVLAGGHRLEPFLLKLGIPDDRLAILFLVALFAIIFLVYFVLEKVFGIYLWGLPMFGAGPSRHRRSQRQRIR